MLFQQSKYARAIVLGLLAALVSLLAACGGSSASDNKPAAQQVLHFPNVGTADIGKFDPASGSDSNSNLANSMVMSGLVRHDANLNVVADQAASWNVSSDNRVYTFKLKPGIEFSGWYSRYGPDICL